MGYPPPTESEGRNSKLDRCGSGKPSALQALKGVFVKISNAIWVLAFLAAQPANAEVMSNESIVTLVNAGIGPDLIIDKINTEMCGYDVSMNSIIALKNSGVDDDVIGAMVRRCATLSQERGISGDNTSSDPKVMHSPGIYAYNSEALDGALTLIRPSKPSGQKTTGNGSLIFPFKTKMVVPGISSHLSVSPDSQEFYFYFDVSDQKVSDFGMEDSAAVQSPSEFTLVELQPKKDSRELIVGKASFYLGVAVGVKKGVDSKSSIPFEVEEVNPGIFKVIPMNGLASGEYAFVLTGANGGARIYDFTVRG